MTVVFLVTGDVSLTGVLLAVAVRLVISGKGTHRERKNKPIMFVFSPLVK